MLNLVFNDIILVIIQYFSYVNMLLDTLTLQIFLSTRGYIGNAFDRKLNQSIDVN